MGKTNNQFKRYVINRLKEMDYNTKDIDTFEDEVYEAILFPVLTDYDVPLSCSVRMDKEEEEWAHILVGRIIDVSDAQSILMTVNNLNLESFGLTFAVDLNAGVLTVKADIDIYDDKFEDCWLDFVGLINMAQEAFIEFE